MCSHVLCLNSGSSSLKFALYAFEGGERCMVAGAVEGLSTRRGRFWVRDAADRTLRDEPRDVPDTRSAVAVAFAVLDELGLPAPAAFGHRIVFGGVHHAAPKRIDDDLLAELRALSRFAPLHMPAEVAAIEATLEQAPGRPQVACFDTAFHRRMPELAQRFPLPRALWDEGVRRIGFHGLSYEYVVSALGAAAIGRGVIAHLGHGASMAAVRDGVSVDTSMGFSPTAGLMMSTRSGDLDPGVMLYLAREKGLDADALERLVTRESGLIGVSGSTGDMAELLSRQDTDASAEQAVAMFCYLARKQIGALAAVLEGLDTLVFTGGIGERAAPVRSKICCGLLHLGIRLDSRLNEAHAAIVSAPESACVVRVVRTDENLIIARHTRALTRAAS